MLLLLDALLFQLLLLLPPAACLPQSQRPSPSNVHRASARCGGMPWAACVVAAARYKGARKLVIQTTPLRIFEIHRTAGRGPPPSLLLHKRGSKLATRRSVRSIGLRKSHKQTNKQTNKQKNKRPPHPDQPEVGDYPGSHNCSGREIAREQSKVSHFAHYRGREEQSDRTHFALAR